MRAHTNRQNRQGQSFVSFGCCDYFPSYWRPISVNYFDNVLIYIKIKDKLRTLTEYAPLTAGWVLRHIEGDDFYSTIFLKVLQME